MTHINPTFYYAALIEPYELEDHTFYCTVFLSMGVSVID